MFDTIARKAKGERAFQQWTKIFEASVTPRQDFHRNKMKPMLKVEDVVLITDFVGPTGKLKTARIIEMVNPRQALVEYVRNNKIVTTERHVANLALIERPSERQAGPFNSDP